MSSIRKKSLKKSYKDLHALSNIIIVALAASLFFSAVSSNAFVKVVSSRCLPHENPKFLCWGLMLLIGLYVAYTRGKSCYPGENRECVPESESEEAMDKASSEQIEKIARLACIGESTSEIVHELRNVLAAISGFTQLLSGVEKGQQQDKYIRKLLAAVDRCNQIAKNILEFTQGGEARKERQDLRGIIIKALRSKSSVFVFDNIKVSTHLPDRSLEVIASDFQLHQVVFNIIINAHYELLKVEHKVFVIRGFKQDDRAIVEFTDSGKGIPERNLEKVFEPFFTTKHEGEGTGLGLSISRNIVEDHGGRLWARSEEGHGATFVLELPLVSHEPEAGMTPEPQRLKQEVYS
ncbi:MAG: ATP-binding protein [Candidatus Tritonobacter lacicola]|nr:ATP-binding protein [Candidatus Tritonobacter lacicola]